MASVLRNERYRASDLTAGQSSASRMSRTWFSASSASLSKEPIIRRGMVESAVSRRGGRPIFLIDLAVPRNIEESCAEIEDAYMYNLKDLSDIANENIEARRAQIERAGDAVKSRAVALWDRLRNKA